MIEILFAESEAASMKTAKMTSIHNHLEEKPASDEVICLGFHLDVGDIRIPIDSDYRKNLLFSLYNQNQWAQEEAFAKELKNAGDFYVKGLHRLNQLLNKGEPIRIWYSNAPYSRCGFYNLCQLLLNYDNEVQTVQLPEYVVHAASTVRYQHWGEVASEEFEGFLSAAKVLSKEEIHMFSIMWHQLTEDNSPLRAMLNGRLISVPESFYDFMIFNRITQKPIKESRLIGDILGCQQIGIGDWWYAKRIQHYIETGKIKVLEDSENAYARLICL